MKRTCPPEYRYAVIQMDPLGMVEHLQDPIATAAAEAMRPQKYLVYLDTALDLPSPTKLWFRFRVCPIAATLRPEDKERGYTSDMVIPIYPNTHHPGSPRNPIHTHPPFPFPNCYHWIDTYMRVRIHRKPTRYDDSGAYRVDIYQHMQICKGFREDRDRLHQFRLEQQAVADKALSMEGRSYPEDDHAASSSQTSSHTDEAADLDDVDSLPEGPDAPESPLSAATTPNTSRRNSTNSVAAIMRLDPFGFNTDFTDEFIPLVHLWFELTEHLTAETIPNPVGIYKEQDTIMRIIHDARERVSDSIELPVFDSGVDLHCDTASSASYSTPQHKWHEYSLLPAELRARLRVVSELSSEPKSQARCMEPSGVWRKFKHRIARIVRLPRTWRVHPPFLPFWP